jgi:hypothetical protein
MLTELFTAKVKRSMFYSVGTRKLTAVIEVVVVVVVVVVKILPRVAGEMHSPYIPIERVSEKCLQQHIHSETQTPAILQVMYGNR